VNLFAGQREKCVGKGRADLTEKQLVHLLTINNQEGEKERKMRSKRGGERERRGFCFADMEGKKENPIASLFY